MKRFDWRILLASILIFIIPPLAVPARGVLSEEITSYVYGFPFSWFTVYFKSRGGKAFLLEVLFELHDGISISILSAVLNLVIIYVVIRAIVTVFWVKRRKHQPPQQPPSVPPAEESEPINAGQSHGADGQ